MFYVIELDAGKSAFVTTVALRKFAFMAQKRIIWSSPQNYSNAFTYLLTFNYCYIILKFIKIIIDNEIPDDLTNHIFPALSTRSFSLKQKP